MAQGLSVEDYSYYRYLGSDTMISNGIRMQPREVVGLLQVNSDLYYIAHPKYDQAVSISGSDGDMLIKNSRPFTAKPNALFPGRFNFTPYEEEKRSAAPAADPVPEPEVVKPKPTPVRVQKVSEPQPEPALPKAPVLQRPSDTDMQPTLPKEMLDDPNMDAAARKAAALRMMDLKAFGKLEPLIYANAIYPGGTANNYAIKPVPKCGKVHLEVMGIDALSVAGGTFVKRGVSPPEYVLKDIQENVMTGIGLNHTLPFKRLYVGITSDTSGSHIVTYRVHGFIYGAISIHPAQLVKYFGGYNSLSMAHVITHELAHFVDDTMLRNVDRMKFDQAIRGKKLHPDSLNARTISSVPAEHFATLAELMVWGASLRNVYTLNGVEIVSKYFENRYIPQADIDSRKI